MINLIQYNSHLQSHLFFGSGKVPTSLLLKFSIPIYRTSPRYAHHHLNPNDQRQPIQNPTKHLIFKTSINRSRDLIKQHTSIYLRKLLKRNIVNEPHLKLHNRLDVILNKRISMALFTMSRSQIKHNLPNNIFEIMVKRKL